MTLYEKANGMTLAVDQAVGTAAYTLEIAEAKRTPLDGKTESVNISILTSGTMPMGTTVTTYFYRDGKQISSTSSTLGAIASTLSSTTHTNAYAQLADSYRVKVVLAGNGGTAYSASVFTTELDKTSENYLAFEGAADDLTFTTTNAVALTAVTTTIQVLDGANNAVSEAMALDVWLSSDSAGETAVTLGGSGSIAITGGGDGALVIPYVAKSAYKLITNATGNADLSIVHSSAATLYLNVEIPNKGVKHGALVWS